jgi:ABC-type phosphate transport system substrate-binding protein
MFRLPRQRAVAALLAASLLLGGAAALAPPPAQAQEPGRTVSVSPAGPYQPNQEVTVSWSGFEPGPTFVTLCTRQAANAGTWSGCAEVTRVAGQTADDGTGSTPFRMHPNPPALTTFGFRNERPPSACVTVGGENSCALTVSDCDVDIRAPHTARTNVDFAFVPAPRPPMIRQPRPVPPDRGPFPVVPPGASRLQGVRSKLVDQSADAWGRALVEDGVQLDLTPVSSVEVNANFASDAVTRAPWGITALPLTDAQRASLVGRGVGYTYVPVGLSALAVSVGMQYAAAPITEVTLPSESLARIYGEPPGDAQIRDWVGPAMEAANDGCQYPAKGSAANLTIWKLYRGDQSEANLWFTTYLDTLHHDLFNAEPGLKYPLEDSNGSASYLTEQETVDSLYHARFLDATEMGLVGDKLEEPPPGRGGRIGYVDLASALQGQVAVATITNAAGTAVRPTADAILAGVTDPPAEGVLGDDDVFFPDFEAQPASAYPMPIVFYALVPTSYQGLPTTAGGQPDVAWSQHLADALEFMVSDEGQNLAAERGWVPLPAEFREAAARGIAAIPTTPAPAPPPAAPGGPGGGFPTGGFGAGSFSDPFASGLGSAFSGGFGDGFGTGGATTLDAQAASATSDASESDEAGVENPASRRLDDSDLTPTVGLLLAVAAIVLVAGRVLVLSGTVPGTPGIRRRKQGPGGPGGAAPA